MGNLFNEKGCAEGIVGLNAVRRFWAWALANAFLWTLLPCAFLLNMPVDTAELLYWARRPQWGYPKHPPLTYWVASLFDRLSGFHIWGQYVAAQVMMLLTFWAVWRLALKFMDRTASLVAVMVLQAVYFYGFMTPEFNHNIVILPFWAWAVYFFWQAISGGRNKYWFLCGFFCGLGLLVKYSFLALILSMFIFVMLHPAARKYLRFRGPYLAMIAAIVAVLPHLVWLWICSGSSVEHAGGRLSSAQGIFAHFYYPLEFGVVQLGAVLPALVLIYFAFRRSADAQIPPENDALKAPFLFTVTAAPFLILAAIALIFGARMRVNMYGSPLWLFSGVAAMYLMKKKIERPDFFRFLKLLLPLYLLWVVIFSLQYTALPYWTHKAKRGHFPGLCVSQELGRQWNLKYGSLLPAVAGDPWVAGNISIYTPSSPAVYTDVGFEFNDIRAAKDELRHTGVLIVWDTKKSGEDYPQRFSQIFPEARVQPPLEARWLTGAMLAPARVGWAIVPPASAPQNIQKSVEA